MGVSNSGTKSGWRVDFNTETCSMCEMCVNRCPTHALFIRRQGNVEDILFDAALCDSCSGDMYCQAHCPEKAVTVSLVPAAALPAHPLVLITGEMTACGDCGKLFVPERKLQTLLEQEKISSKSVQSYCPTCRREHLLDSYLILTGQMPDPGVQQ
jgi:ferredoxin